MLSQAITHRVDNIKLTEILKENETPNKIFNEITKNVDKKLICKHQITDSKDRAFMRNEFKRHLYKCKEDEKGESPIVTMNIIQNLDNISFRKIFSCFILISEHKSKGYFLAGIVTYGINGYRGVARKNKKWVASCYGNLAQINTWNDLIKWMIKDMQLPIMLFYQKGEKQPLKMEGDTLVSLKDFIGKKNHDNPIENNNINGKAITTKESDEKNPNINEGLETNDPEINIKKKNNIIDSKKVSKTNRNLPSVKNTAKNQVSSIPSIPRVLSPVSSEGTLMRNFDKEERKHEKGKDYSNKKLQRSSDEESKKPKLPNLKPIDDFDKSLKSEKEKNIKEHISNPINNMEKYIKDKDKEGVSKLESDIQDTSEESIDKQNVYKNEDDNTNNYIKEESNSEHSEDQIKMYINLMILTTMKLLMKT